MKSLFDPKIFDVRIFRNRLDGPDFTIQGNYRQPQVDANYLLRQVEGHWRNAE